MTEDDYVAGSGDTKRFEKFVVVSGCSVKLIPKMGIIERADFLEEQLGYLPGRRDR